MPRLFRPTVLAAALLLAAPVVAYAQDTAATQPAPVKKKKRGDLNRITRDDLEGSIGGYVSALDIIRALRPRWLNPTMAHTSVDDVAGRPRGGATEIIFYIDGTRQPSINEVSTLRAALVVEMRYSDQNRAIQMFGTGHELGVIEIMTTGTPR